MIRDSAAWCFVSAEQDAFLGSFLPASLPYGVQLFIFILIIFHVLALIS